ncbi:hypothetical protein GALMADRAFT_1302408 [Galerina marginata CBS 339.88]|uniref:Uncharacterized protein n=1 Tax=Galerina marginata (strain CBS 339.88) TaxID=685588 RepID=A0A067TGL4_GALM3|nr:hypothetical protein GALMADRAFT_1302408 [Galerina marginata CBS 339.88]
MDIIWNMLSSFSIPRPFYVSEERLPPSPRLGPSKQNVTISTTPYRILVCLVVASFGLSKAMLGYYELSTAMTWTEWALAVPVTTILYCLGLYEYNSSNMWPYFFEVDLYDSVCSLTKGL